MRRMWRKLYILLALIAALSGCRPAADKTESPSVLRVAYKATVASLDPIMENTVISNSIYCNIFEPLVVRDANLHITPALATEWSNPDDRTWIFKLRPGLRFHNGAPLRAEDVKFSIERARNNPSSQISSSLTPLERVDILDPGTIRITTRGPYSILLSRLVDIWILPEAHFAHPAGAGDIPPGTGPYYINEWKPSSYVHLKANEKYWGGTPPISEVRFEAIPDLRRRVDALFAGSLHILPLLEPSALKEPYFKRSESVKVLTSSSLATILLGMDLWRDKTPYASTPSNPFRDLRVRQAIYQAINIDHIVRDILHNYATAATQVVAPKVFGFNESLKRPGYDPEQARRLLKEAGYPNGFDVRFDITNDRYRNDAEVGAAIAQDLAAVGIRASLHPVPMKEFLPIFTSRDTSLYMMGFTLPSTDASGAFDFLIHTRDLNHGYGRDNCGGYSNPEVDRLIERSSETMAPENRAKLLMEAMARTMQDLPMIPLHVESSVSMCSSHVEWDNRPDEYLYCNTIRFKP